MLAYLLAIAVGLGSFGLYMAAFFLPEVYRKYDLIWSGVGLFYALVLWVCANRITGGLLLGQIASVALLGWLSWQMLQLRRQQTPPAQQTQLPAATTSEVVRATVQQFRSSLQNSQRSPGAAQLSRWVDRVEAVWIDITSWFKALNTTVEPSNSVNKPYTPPSAPSPQSPFQAQSPPQPPNPASVSSPNYSVVNPTREISIEADATDDLYAEWGELEVESYPELDTVDGASLDGGTTNQRLDLKSNPFKNGSSRKPLIEPERSE